MCLSLTAISSVLKQFHFASSSHIQLTTFPVWRERNTPKFTLSLPALAADPYGLPPRRGTQPGEHGCLGFCPAHHPSAAPSCRAHLVQPHPLAFLLSLPPLYSWRALEEGNMMKSLSNCFRKIQTHRLCFEALHKLAPSFLLWLPFFHFLYVLSESTTTSHFRFLEVYLPPLGLCMCWAPVVLTQAPPPGLRGDLTSPTSALGLGQAWLGHLLCTLRLIQR